VADKLTQQIIEALTKAAAEQAGLPLYGGKTDPGLFLSSTAGKTAAQKCLGDGYLRCVGTEPRGKRDVYSLTDKGWEYLLAQVNPKQVLEDFVRVLETRQGEVGELLDTARRMADSLHGLKEAVTRVLPAVSAARITPRTTPLSPREAGEREALSASRHPASLPECIQSRMSFSAGEPERPDYPAVHVEPAEEPVGSAHASGLDLAAEIQGRLREWSGAAGEDCPLPALFRKVAHCEPAPTIGEFHDCLRRLCADGVIYLHPWAGPLYALPEPAYALLSGHSIAYYASIRA
jgi:hypothetical protein